ncbi:response regulator transcription factor [Herbaspirillum sp. GCM10030257]|uniref:response regulator transcription factor n=1 Tax=Herbaspirillum sp. GCM10030257 TaxID=3273393 RepID=UPI00360648FC
MMNKTVFVIDNERSGLQSVTKLLRSAGHALKEFTSSKAFLCEPLQPSAACVILNMHHAETSGVEVLDALEQRAISMPVICVTEYGSISMCVRAMRAGAWEFLAKPIDSETLLRAVDQALMVAHDTYKMQCDLFVSKQRYDTLTRREREVLSLALNGLLNKQIACRLGIQEGTVKLHKRKVMEKMGTKRLVDLIRMTALIKGQVVRGTYESFIKP